MKINTGLENYKFGTKNNWRRWAWNEATKRLKESGKSPRNAVVAYLAGPQDIDRKIAIEKGYDNRNLIAIDNDLSVVKSIREKKCLAFHGNIEDFIDAYDYDPEIDILIVDYCCGVTYNVAMLTYSLIYHTLSTKNITIIANFLRGRDKIGAHEGKKIKTKHRGEIFFKIYTDTIFDFLNKDNNAYDISDKIKNNCNAIFNTYKSGEKTIMDSVILTILPFGYFLRKQNIDPQKDNKDKEIINAKRQIAALKAHRTMRFNRISK